MRFVGFLASSVLLALGFLSPDAHAESLVAPVYPGAVHAPEYDNGFTQVWLSKDPHEMVLDWYRKRIGPAKRKREEDWFFLVLEQPKTRDMLHEAGLDWTMAQDAGVRIKWKREPPAEYRCLSSDHFMTLRQLLMRGKGTQEQFDALCKRLGWIESAYFRLHSSGQEAMPEDAYLYERDRNALARTATRGAADTEALGLKIQELAMQGRFDEATRLSQSLGEAHQQSATLPEDAWSQWSRHLESVSKAAFRTKITIHRQPTDWEAP